MTFPALDQLRSGHSGTEVITAACVPRWGAARGGIVSVSRHAVTARITAHQTDGTVDTYQGTYTVDNGVIVGFDVLQVG